MIIQGQIQAINYSERIISIKNKRQRHFIHLTNKDMREFRKYLSSFPFIVVACSDERRKFGNLKAHELSYFIRIVSPIRHGLVIHYELAQIQNDIKKLINGLGNRLFIDLEFTLPDSKQNSDTEIVQYGLILENKHGQVIAEETALLKPFNETTINERTLKFLSLEAQDFETAQPYIVFYQKLDYYLKTYDAKIIAWGNNDRIALRKSFKTNYLRALPINKHYINLMQVMKNYYNWRQEKGLFDLYKKFSHTTKELVQTHNALEDARKLRSIFYMFKGEINQ